MMASKWVEPAFDRRAVNAAAGVLLDHESPHGEVMRAMYVVNNWRSAHGFPLNTIQMGLRNKAQKVHPQAIIAQRLKRVQSIVPKLREYPSMKLSQMQDLGGCRAVLRSIQDVNDVRQLYESSRSPHQRCRLDDYIAAPAHDGYRGVHLVYRFEPKGPSSFRGLKIEVQLRTGLQHAWATAVETVGTFTRQSLKSGHGSKEWLEFFRLAAAAFAIVEKSPLPPSAPDSIEVLVRRLAELESRLEVRHKLAQYRHALTHGNLPPSAAYYLMSLNSYESRLRVYSYRKDELERATDDYVRAEQQLELFPGDVVLVAADSVKALRRAYPNYFMDTQIFVRQLVRFMGLLASA